jgi:probable F420-dependent oxidoreductase
MEFWQSIAVTEMEHLVELAKFAEEVGFTGVTVADHLVKPREIRSPYPYTPDGQPFWSAEEPFPDPWVLIAAIARETTRLRFMPYVYVLPLRDPFNAAKAISTAAILSGDRVILGVGVGWMQEEFELAGQQFEARGQRTDEMIEVIARLISGEPVEYHGEFYDFEVVQMAPAPVRPVEVRIGGYSRPALRRAARNDGWLGLAHEPEEVEKIVAFIHEERRLLGREAAAFDFMIAHYSTRPDCGEYERYRDAGATSIHVPSWRYLGIENATLDEKRRGLEEFAERYIVPMAKE